MQPNVEGTHESTGNSDESENEQLLGIEGKFHGEVCDEHGGYGFLALKPNGQKTKHGSATYGGEETAPVVSNREVNGRDLDAEEHTADRGGEARGYPDRASGREHLAVPALVLVDTLETRHQLRQQGRDYTGYVHKWTWKCLWLFTTLLVDKI